MVWDLFLLKTSHNFTKFKVENMENLEIGRIHIGSNLSVTHEFTSLAILSISHLWAINYTPTYVQSCQSVLENLVFGKMDREMNSGSTT